MANKKSRLNVGDIVKHNHFYSYYDSKKLLPGIIVKTCECPGNTWYVVSWFNNDEITLHFKEYLIKVN